MLALFVAIACYCVCEDWLCSFACLLAGLLACLSLQKQQQQQQQQPPNRREDLFELRVTESARPRTGTIFLLFPSYTQTLKTTPFGA